MRIAYYHHGPWPSRAPSATFITFNALGFRRTGADLTVVTTARDRGEPDTVLRNEFGITEPLPVKAFRAGPFKNMHQVAYRLAFRWLCRAGFDVIITRNLGFLPFALRLRGKTGVRVFFEAHDFFSDAGEGGLHGPGRLKQRRQEERWLPRVNGIICVSAYQEKLYNRYYPDVPSVTAVTGVKTGTDPYPREKAGTTLGYLGSFNRKLYDLELPVSVLEKSGTPGLKLVMAGARNERETASMHALVRQYGVEDRVTVLPWTSPAGLEEIKRTVDIGLCPIRISERNRMASPLKVLEYLSAGIPVITTPLDGIADILGKGQGGISAAPDPVEWASAVDSIFGDPESYRAMSRAALEAGRAFTWERRAGKIMDFLKMTAGTG